MRIRVRRVLAISAIAVAALIVLTLLIIHIQAVQSRVLAWSIAELERRFDLDLIANDLHYNLAYRSVVLTNVRLAAVGHRDNPFFSANAVQVQFPWAAYLGRLRFNRIIVDRGVVTITRDVNDISNLPPGRGRRDPNAPPRRLDVRGLDVQQLDFVYRDYRRDVDIRAAGLRTSLDYELVAGAAVGTLVIDGGVNVRVKQRRVAIKPVKGRMSFDGSNVGLAEVSLDTSDGALILSGQVTRSLDRPTLDLKLKGTTDIARASHWTTPPVHVAGPASFEATMTGAPSAFVLDVHLVSRNAEVGDERRVSIDARSRLTPQRLSVSRSTITPPTGGEIHATADVPFDDDELWWVEANYRGLDAVTAFRLADVNPLPFGAALAGNARIEGPPGQPFKLEVHNKSAARTARGTAPLEGDVDFFIEGNRWRANQRHRMGSTTVHGAIGGNWNRQSPTRSTFDGKLAVQTGDVGEAARYAALFGLDTPAVVRNSKGPMQADVTIGGIFIEPRFMGEARSDSVDIPSVGNTALTANFDVSERALNFTNIDATVGGARMLGNAHADLVTRSLQGELEVEAPSAADLLTALPEEFRLEGALAAKALLGGTVDAPEITADISGSGLSLAGQPIESLVAKARVVDEGVNVESLTVNQGQGVLRATGRYEWNTRTFTVNLDGQDLTWRGTLARLGDAVAGFSLKFSGGGSIDRPTGEGVLEFQVRGGLAGELIDKGVANVRLNGDTALVTGHIPTLGAFINSTVTLQKPFPYEAVIVMNRVDLEPAVALAGLRQGHLSGTASLSATAKGTLSSIADSQAFINLQELQADFAGVPVRLVTPSRLSWSANVLTVDALDVAVGNGRLSAAGSLGEGGITKARWEATFKGELGDLLKIGRTFGVPPELEGFGPVNIVWQSTGGLDRSTATVQLAGGSLAWAELPAIRDLTVDANFNGTTLEVTRLMGKWQDGGIEGTASIPRAVLEAREAGGPLLPPTQAGFAKLKVTALSEEALAPWLSKTAMASIDGRLSATLDARITRSSLDGVTGTLVLDEADFTLAGVKVSQVRPSVLDVQGGIVTVKDVSFNAGGSPLTLTGTARLTPTDKQTLDLKVGGTADLRILSAFTPTVAADGEAKINVGIGGALRSPVFNGRIDVANAEMAIRDPRVLIAELNGTIALDGQRVLFDNFRGSANGGLLTLDGGFLLEGFTPSSGGLTIVLDGAALEYPQGLQSEADALVTLRPSPTGWTLIGDINVERSVYNETISIPALLAARRTRPPVAPGEASWGERLRLNLFVTTLQDLRVDNNYGRFEAGAALRVIGTVAEPVLAGRVTLREGGEVYLAGNTFHISRGSLSFTNPNRIVPEFDIELRTLVSGSDIALTLEGPIDRLETEVRSSDPDIDSREATAMLFGGFRGEDAVTLLSAELLGVTGRRIGLDTLRVQRGFETEEFRADPGLIATETDPSTRLTLSKRLRPEVELILSQSLRESGGLSAIISYKPRRNVEIRAVSRDNVDRSIALRHEITFGGGDIAVASGSSEQPSVSSISISGEPGLPEPELIALLELDAGDKFDFHRWQRDIDRLREEYHERDFYEVRVRGTRQVSEDGTSVTLDYRIEPGPVAELVIQGHPLEPELEADIRAAWMRTIFDRFLLEDIRSRILRHLIQENIVGSKVDAVVAAATPERKQIRVTVMPGTEVSRRIIEYSGNHAFDADQLDTVVHDAALDVDAWLDPSRLAGALENFYRSEGYLAVTVKADQSVVQGNIGKLPVTIDEGRRFLIGVISFPGVSPQRLPDVAGAARLDSGIPYVIAEIDEARRRVEDYYARQGFNTLQIEVDAEPDPEASTVSVEFAILEGLQQILRDVTTAGASRTREGVIRRALRLRVGEPVNLADWAQARKRMYDTNVFRQVDIEPVPITPTTEESAAGVQPVRAVVRVVEYPVWRFRYGAQFTDEESEVPDPDGDTRLQSFGVLADLQNQNVFGRAITAGIAARYERNRQAGSLFTSNGSFFGLPIRSSGFIFTSRQRFFRDENFTEIQERVGLSAEQRWRPFTASELIWSYRFERLHTFDPDPAAGELIPFDVVAKVSKLNAALLLDRRDDPSDPTRGWFTSANWEQALRALGSDLGNGNMLLQQSYYRAVGKVTLAGRAQLGTSFGESLNIVSERFLLGGATTVRGYAENSLGPRNSFGIPIGGDALLALNAEMRFPVRGWVQGVAFYDAGNVFPKRGDLSFRDLATGYGFGLRLASPFAMLRVDFGIPGRTLTPARPANQFRSGRWYFGIGHIF